MKAFLASAPITNLFSTRKATFDQIASDTLSSGDIVVAARWTTEGKNEKSFAGFMILDADGGIVTGPTIVAQAGAPFGEGVLAQPRINLGTLVALDDSGFALSWTDAQQSPADGPAERQLQIFNNSGAERGGAFDPYPDDVFSTTYTLAPLSEGGFATIERSDGFFDSTAADLEVRVFDQRGRRVGETVEVNIEGSANSFSFAQSIARGPDGETIIILNVGDSSAIARLDGTGQPVGTGTIVSNKSENFDFSREGDATVADIGGGKIVVAYGRSGLDADDGIVVQTMNPDGTDRGKERILPTGEGFPRDLTLVSLEGNGALALWVDGASGRLLAQEIRANGKFKGPVTDLTSIDIQGGGIEVVRGGDGDLLVTSANRFAENAITTDVIATKLSGDAEFGSRRDDTITTGKGDQVVSGERGDDRIELGDGNDAGHGDVGNDRIFGGDGDDLLHGDAGRDTLAGDDGSDILRGGADADDLKGGGGADILRGGTGDDKLNGDGGNDELNGNEGNDKVLGGGGDDILRGVDGNDKIKGGGGDDTMAGGEGNDKLFGGAGDDRLLGFNGNDLLKGGGGNDVMFAEDGRDVLVGGGGADVFVFDIDAGRAVAKDFDTDADMLEIRLSVSQEQAGLDTAQIFDEFASVANGNTVIDLGEGRTMTFNGVRDLEALEAATTAVDFFGNPL